MHQIYSALRVYTAAYGEHVAGAFESTRHLVLDATKTAASVTSDTSEMSEFEGMLSDTDLWIDADLISARHSFLHIFTFIINM